jgi:hypothetical protein
MLLANLKRRNPKFLHSGAEEGFTDPPALLARGHGHE